MTIKNFQFQESLNQNSSKKVIIFLNAGGWGNTPIEKADDLAPILKGIEKTLSRLGHEIEIIDYKRVEDGFFEKIKAIGESFDNNFKKSKKLSKIIEKILVNNSQTKIIMVGLSNGALFVDETIKKIPKEIQKHVYAIEVGPPFWQKNADSENVLRLNNKNKDSLTKGETKKLLLAALKAPLVWFLGKISGTKISFPKSFRAPGHQYPWESPEVGDKIVSFLEKKI
ncbi:hypothetical protein ACFLYY_01710 [Patescibacteria group bacterium]